LAMECVVMASVIVMVVFRVRVVLSIVVVASSIVAVASATVSFVAMLGPMALFILAPMLGQ